MKATSPPRGQLLFAGLALALVVATTGHTEPTVRTLTNGMTLIVEEMRGAPVAAVRIYVRAGSVYEAEYAGAGITHFLEHLVGRASTTRSTEDIERLEESLGGQSNAYTTSDHTCYFMTSAARYVNEVISLLADYVFHPLLDPAEVETQRGIILREMAMNEDDPGRKLYELLNRTVFRIHPERLRVIGYPARFTAVTREDLVRYHNRMYTPENAVAVVVGDFDSAQVLQTLEAALGSLPRSATLLPALPDEPAQMGERRAEEIDPQLSRAYLAMAFRTVSLFHPDLYPLDTLAYILTNGDSSRLVSTLRDELGLVDYVSCFSDTPVYNAGMFAITAALDEDKLAEVEQRIIRELDRLKREPVGAAELQRAKKQKAAELVYARADPQSRAASLGSDFLATGDVRFSERYVDAIRGVTPEQVMAVARRYFLPANRTVVTRRAGKTAPTTSVATPATVPQTRRKVLPNGIVLLVQRDTRAPMVCLQAAFRGGLRAETPQNAGIGRLMAAMLDRGTRTRSRLEIARLLDGSGASLSFGSGRDSFTASGSALAEDAEMLVSLAADCLRNPAFAPAELERVRELTLDAIRAQDDDANGVAFRLAMRTFFTTYPYGLDPLGTADSVAAITREALVAHHALICQPRGMVLSICGDLPPEQAEALATRYFGDWESRPVDLPQPVDEAPPEGERRAVRERGQQQGIIYFIFPGPGVGSPDRYALDVLDGAFSGIGYPAGRLHARLRGEQLVYGTHMIPAYRLGPGYVVLYAATEPDKLEQVEAIIRELIAAVQQEPMTEDELNRGKRMCIVAHEVERASLASRAYSETLDELLGLGFAHGRDYSNRIEAVTASQVQAAARKYLDLSHCAIAITRPPTEGG